MICFPNPGKENTAETIRIALEAAQARGMNIVAATTRGGTAVELVKASQACNFPGEVIIVSHAYRAGGNTMPAETRQWLEAQPKVRVVTAAHALSGAERVEGVPRAWQHRDVDDPRGGCGRRPKEDPGESKARSEQRRAVWYQQSSERR